MTKTMMIAAAMLSFGSAGAIAQTMPQESAPPATTNSSPNDMTPPMAPATGAPGATDPGMSAPAPADAGPTPPSPGRMATTAAAGSAPDTSSYPTCSRGVTDKCVQKAGMGKKARRR